MELAGMKEKQLKRRVQEKIADPQCGDDLFLIGYAMYLATTVWVTTMFPMTKMIQALCMLISLICIAIKIFLYGKYSMKKVLILVATGLCCVVGLYRNHYVYPLIWFVLIAGSDQVPFEKILKVYLLIVGAIVFLAFAASMLGVIPNLQYETSTRGIRNSFGIIYPTDCGAHVFFWMLTFFYLKGKNLRGVHYLFGLITTWAVYRFCNARIDAGSILMTTALFGLGNFISYDSKCSRRIKRIWERLWERLGGMVMPLLAFVSILFTYLYSDGNAVWEKMDGTLLARFKLGKQAFEDYGLKLFGQKIPMNGNGGTLNLVDEYFFLDCSYVNILLTWGLILFLSVMILFIYSCTKNRKDLYFQYAIAAIAVNSMIAHHLMDVAYNPFVLAIAAGVIMRASGLGKNRIK